MKVIGYGMMAAYILIVVLMIYLANPAQGAL